MEALSHLSKEQALRLACVEHAITACGTQCSRLDANVGDAVVNAAAAFAQFVLDGERTSIAGS